MSGFTFEKHSKHCTLRFTPAIAQMPWAEVEAVTGQVKKSIHEASTEFVLVDLSQLQKLPTGLVASLVRTWKELDEGRRRFVVVAPHTSVREELDQAGLSSLWKIVPSVADGHAALGVLGDTDVEMSQIPLVETANPKSEPSEPFAFEEQKRYCSVTLSPMLMTMNWTDVQAATSEVIAKLEAAKKNSVMVDLSSMTMINSGIIASLVRIWKKMQERKWQFSVVSPNEVVSDVLKVAGLLKVWSVVDDREEAIYDLGASKVALVENRERRLLMLVAVLCAVFAGLALIPMFMNRTEVMGVNSQLTALLLAAAGLATGTISAIKDTGARRAISLLAVVISISVLSTVWFKGNPVASAQQLPQIEIPLPDTPGENSTDEKSTATPRDDEGGGIGPETEQKALEPSI